MTDAERMKLLLEDPHILMANRKVGSVQDLLPIEGVISPQRPTIIAEGCRRRLLGDLEHRQQAARHVYRHVAVKAPGLADCRKRMLEDIAISWAAKLPKGRQQAETRKHADLGGCWTGPRAVVDKDNTTIVDGAGELEQIKARINQIEGRDRFTDSGLRS